MRLPRPRLLTRSVQIERSSESASRLPAVYRELTETLVLGAPERTPARFRKGREGFSERQGTALASSASLPKPRAQVRFLPGAFIVSPCIPRREERDGEGIQRNSGRRSGGPSVRITNATPSECESGTQSGMRLQPASWNEGRASYAARSVRPLPGALACEALSRRSVAPAAQSKR